MIAFKHILFVRSEAIITYKLNNTVFKINEPSFNTIWIFVRGKTLTTFAVFMYSMYVWYVATVSDIFELNRFSHK